MPFIREQFANASIPVGYYVDGVKQWSGSVVLDSAELLGFRAKPHRNAISAKEVTALSADPYAYFLDSTSRKKYHDRLTERGLQPQGDPDRGHPMELKKHTLIGPRLNVTKTATTSPFTRQFFQNCVLYPTMGGLTQSILDPVHTGGYNGPAPYKETGLDVFAQQAYSRVAPTSVVFDAALFLGELREGLPKLIPAVLSSGTKLFRAYGNDYLNIEFGWKPFLNDIQNAARALMGATELLAQQGQRVHRRYSLPLVTQHGTATDTNVPLIISVANNRGFATGFSEAGSTTSTGTSSGMMVDALHMRTRSSERWFEGEFSSFYPLDFNPNDYFDRFNVLVNPKITPSTLWELAPWSWLVDWQLRIGDTIRANEINANDLLIMHYGYAMETTTYSSHASWKYRSGPPSSFALDGHQRDGFIQSTTVYKRRLRANPYGFRIGGFGSLTPSRTAILGALGLTKLKT